MIYNSSEINYIALEEQRKNEERERNLQRLIVYNNKRIKAGLPPLEYPPELWRPLHRDVIRLSLR